MKSYEVSLPPVVWNVQGMSTALACALNNSFESLASSEIACLFHLNVTANLKQSPPLCDDGQQAKNHNATRRTSESPPARLRVGGFAREIAGLPGRKFACAKSKTIDR